MIHESWKPLLDQYDFDLDELYNSPIPIYPLKENVFKAFELDVTKIKVCILGQDPYHNPNEAMGLSFSVPKDVKIPPSLRNIFKEIQIEFPTRKYEFSHGDLTQWMDREHIFLLNSSLTVKKNSPSSHMEIWKEFTDDVIKYLSEKNKDCVFVLLGNFSKSKKKFIKDLKRIVEGVHPSPLSAHAGFFNSSIFKKIEELTGKEINWQN